MNKNKSKIAEVPSPRSATWQKRRQNKRKRKNGERVGGRVDTSPRRATSKKGKFLVEKISFPLCAARINGE